MLGRIYYDGLVGLKHTGQPDFKSAVTWFSEAAALGSAKGKFNLGLTYEYGLGGLPQVS